eukprot:1838307-Prymnesium_polylepis.1
MSPWSKSTKLAEERVMLEAPGREVELRDALTETWRTGRFADLEVVAGGRTFKAHRTVLAAESAYFKALLGTDHFLEGRSCRVELADVAAEAMEHALDF